MHIHTRRSRQLAFYSFPWYSSVLNWSHVATIWNMSFIWIMSFLQIWAMCTIWINSFFKMRHVYYLDCVEFYLSHVLTKFLIVGRALCTKNQSHNYYLDCVKSISEPWVQSNSIIVEKMVDANLSTILDFSTILDSCVCLLYTSPSPRD